MDKLKIKEGSGTGILTVRVDITEVRQMLDKYGRVANKFINQALYASANEIAKFARTKIRTGKRSGRIYRIGMKLHRASAPGEYPARATKGRGVAGGLAGGIIWGRIFGGARITSRADYSGYLEYGTRNIRGSTTENNEMFQGGRPFMRPSLAANKKNIMTNISKAIKKIKVEAHK